MYLCVYIFAAVWNYSCTSVCLSVRCTLFVSSLYSNPKGLLLPINLVGPTRLNVKCLMVESKLDGKKEPHGKKEPRARTRTGTLNILFCYALDGRR
jgi:hypothetical protein